MYDTENEIANSMWFFPRSNSSRIDEAVVCIFSSLLDDNGYVCLFESARELCSLSIVHDFGIKLYSMFADRRYC